MLAVGASRLTQAAVHVGHGGDEIAYAAGSSVIFWHPGKPQTAIHADSEVTALAAGADRLLVGTKAGAALVYQNGELAKKIQLDAPITCVALDESLVAVGTSSKKVYLSGRINREYILEYTPLCMAVAGPLLAVGGSSVRFSIVDLETDESVNLEGHTNWVRGLDFWPEQNEYVLASASQDKFIRLWRLKRVGGAEEQSAGSSLPGKVHIFGGWTAVYEALLVGHDDGVVAISWNQRKKQLLSSSSDSSLIVWQGGSDDSNNYSDQDVWMPFQRLGDVSISGSSTATGGSGGFWSAVWTDKYVATISRTGALRLWLSDDGEWAPTAGPTGHTRSVTDVCWMNGALLSTSLDQTTRMWRTSPEGVLYELSRAQIHGYDMLVVATLDDSRFISAGDEKTARVFEMPRQIAHLLKENHMHAPHTDNLPEIASVPALSLSNKTTPELEGSSINNPPREDQLQRLTLWPEIEKLYGHGFEISAVDVSPSHRYVATCCRAKNERYAVVRIYDAEDGWRQLAPLHGLTMTATRLRYSPNGDYLLAVSRDRQWILFGGNQEMLAKPRAHARIIWDAAWVSPTEFVTASRDRSLRKWNTAGELLGTINFDAPATACDARDGVVAVGLETGAIKLLSSADLREVPCDLKGEGRINRVALSGGYLAIASNTLRVGAL